MSAEDIFESNWSAQVLHAHGTYMLQTDTIVVLVASPSSGACPTNDISIEFEIRPKLGAL